MPTAKPRVGASDVKVPSPSTLKKYGMTAADFIAVWERQKKVCAICKRVPSSGRICIDHEHAPNWKTLKPQYRKLFVRGLLCFFCNYSYCGRGVTIPIAQNLLAYLVDHEVRRTLDN